MTATPWMKWYPGDWRADPRLRSCSPIARYVWMEMLGLMHEADDYGHLEINGRAPDIATLSRLIGVDASDTKLAVKELDRNGVFSRTDAGMIFSRRMVRDKSKAEKAKEIGARGGNPALINQGLKPTSVNPPVNGEVIAQKPEARDQYPLEDSCLGNPRDMRLSVFPSDGSISFGPWAAIARTNCPGADVDLLASRFRQFIHEKGGELNAKGIDKSFATFCKGQKFGRKAA